MNTDNFIAWQALLNERDKGLYLLLALAAFLVGSYLISYLTWIPPKYGRIIRGMYEVGGIMLYIGLVIISLKP